MATPTEPTTTEPSTVPFTVPSGQTGTTFNNRAPEVIHRLTFSSETVKQLTANDFDLDSKEMITLKYNDCMLVLFYVENTESYELADIWATVARQVSGPMFGAVNMLSERKVAGAFTRVKSDGSNPLHGAALRQYPFILIYRNRWPVASYNGKRNVQSIIDYSLTLACEAGYYELKQVGGGMQANPENNTTMESYQGFDLQDLGVNSTNYNNSIRRFDPTILPINEDLIQPVPAPPGGTPPPTTTTTTPPPSTGQESINV